MRKFIVVLFLYLSVFFCVSGKGFNKFALQKLHPQGTLFFVFPQKAIAFNATTVKGVLFDFTLLSANSYVTFLSTIKSDSAIKVDSIAIGTEGKQVMISKPVELFRDVKGNKRILRLETTFDKILWQEVFSNQSTPLVTYYLSNGTKAIFRVPYGKQVRKNYAMLFELINASK